MTVPTWNQLTFLTAPQQATGAALAIKGQEYIEWKNRRGPKPDMSGFTSPQLRIANGLFKDLETLLSPARIAIQLTLEERQDAVVAAWKAEP